MWHNLKTCRILYDGTGRLTVLKKDFDVEYPRELKRNIVQRNMKLMNEHAMNGKLRIILKERNSSLKKSI